MVVLVSILVALILLSLSYHTCGKIWHFEKNGFRFVKIHFIDNYVLSDIFCLHMFKGKI